MKSTNYLKKISLYTLLLTSITFAGCEDEVVPEEENEEEIITDIKLIFTNNENAEDVVAARAQDPDGAGIKELAILDTINLEVSQTYTLTFEVVNNLVSPGVDIAAEIDEESQDHQTFFSFSDNAFANPTGNGNIDNSSDPLNYNDLDKNKYPIGLSTTWTTPSTPSSGTFTVRLQHQSDSKTSTSGANDGDTDFELEFVLNIK